MLVAHKVCLKPNKAQAACFARAAGTVGFTYSWIPAESGKQYLACTHTLTKPSQMSLRLALTDLKREEFLLISQASKSASHMAIMRLDSAFQNFFVGRKMHPEFRKKNQHDRFSFSHDQLSVNVLRIRIPRLGWVRMPEALRFAGKIISATFSRVANQWCASIIVELPDYTPKTAAEDQVEGGEAGGKRGLATLSNREKILGPQELKNPLHQLKPLAGGLRRKAKGSQNRSKPRMKVAQRHARISAIRQDGLHQLTSSLTRRFDTIAIEDPNVQGMAKKDTVKNRHLARAIADMGFFEFRRQLDYQARWGGGQRVVVDPWFASSKTCSHGARQLESLPLGVREGTCPKCNSGHHRGLNAAANLQNMAVSLPVTVYGAGGSGLTRKNRLESASVSGDPTAGYSGRVWRSMRERKPEYKERQGGQRVVVDPWFASSETCSPHELADFSLSMRELNGPHCNSISDRAMNTAINLKNMAVIFP